ncbi:VCBS domain-containing protein [Cognatiyoonia sp. IB215182]|uniref:VCBS domain-containing protein n=1 Tax=Cognatiyoonia sp. IB215182 TaxID=3097353 RepID=UPI002A154D95|nr:VCBS domain-containing protein [Cognatiyoonia sp. IB215182]MDX8355844.1 VCBS domain-containing protein [Cognatiyoonia sp. IB215182]
MTAVAATNTHGAAMALSTDRTISYDPTGADTVVALAGGQTPTDTFIYTVESGNGEENVANVSGLVQGRREAPIMAALTVVMMGTRGGGIHKYAWGNDHL